ncbi:hypothetical protein ACQPZP_06150 [Spirillospora sp. CA-142024]|uniref:hypothetical protein n=1 Tax=Spirillospora sp. CA-142024 TaxID=3240036 RepID=UPI003D94E69E
MTSEFLEHGNQRRRVVGERARGRALLNGTPVDGTVTTTLVWCVALFFAFCPLAVRAYGRQQ